ncbi:MAG TPA: hypothetical protein VMG10_22510 [Gemmataceae bacterium]|nr:hypothetical protein [Gemmataceae bacterium]
MTTSVSARSPGTLNPTRQQLDELDALLQRMLELPVNKLDDVGQVAAEEPADEPLPPVQPAPPPPPDPLPTLQAGSGHTVRATRPATPPVSYMVVETASPRPLPPASGFEPRPSALTPRLMPVTPPKVETREMPVPQEQKSKETPVPQQETPLPTKDEELWVPLRSTWQPSAQTWQPLAESWHQAHSGQPVSEPAPGAIPSPPIEQSPPLIGDASHASPGSSPISPDLPPPKTDTAPVSPAPAAEPPLSLSAEDAPEAVPPLLLPLLWFNQGFDACLAPLGAPGRWLCGSRGRQTLGIVGLTCLAAAVAIAVSAGMGWTW